MVNNGLWHFSEIFNSINLFFPVKDTYQFTLITSLNRKKNKPKKKQIMKVSILMKDVRL